MNGLINRLAFGCNSWRILGINHREVKITRISVDSLNCNVCQSQTMSFIGILLAMFGSLLGFLGIKKRRND
jgi:hypothetical protein